MEWGRAVPARRVVNISPTAKRNNGIAHAAAAGLQTWPRPLGAAAAALVFTAAPGVFGGGRGRRGFACGPLLFAVDRLAV